MKKKMTKVGNAFPIITNGQLGASKGKGASGAGPGLSPEQAKKQYYYETLVNLDEDGALSELSRKLSDIDHNQSFIKPKQLKMKDESGEFLARELEEHLDVEEKSVNLGN
jgi:DUF4097 and DUF4098 domain-containing protein YvlB